MDALEDFDLGTTIATAIGPITGITPTGTSDGRADTTERGTDVMTDPDGGDDVRRK
ncbi:MAG: hypothetical protein OXC25_07670 [Thiotrichales bacterium]|nr:hypothetical protein [Thiotrichales bacterium]MCY4283983.1 hypothetical protein [Thiotrichales bacterium]MCY4349709.1 hypothetical protein [Thiotrichales bacterium]